MKLRFEFIVCCGLAAVAAGGAYAPPRANANSQPTARQKSPEHSVVAPDATANDDGAVYAAVFADIYQATAETQIMIVDHTSIGVPPGMWAVTAVKGPDTAKFMAKVPVDAQQDYQLKNKQSERLPQPCHIAPQCALYNVVDLTGIVGVEKAKMEKGWREFNKRYPNAPGIFVVSRIGFNQDHTAAVMYAAKACGNLCGDGQYVRLEKHDGVWAVAAQTTVWIA